MINLHSLWNAFQGDQTKKVTVNKQWLREVHTQLAAYEQLKADIEKVGRSDTAFDKLFGKRGKFGDLFNGDKF